MNRQNLLIIFILITVFTLYVVKIILTTETATSGIEIATMQRDINQYKEESSHLTDLILHETSLNVLEKKASAAGFIKATYIYIK